MEISRVDAAIDHAVSEIAKTDAAIEQVREDYLSIVVTNPQDQYGYHSAETALKKMVRIRTTVEKTRKALKADSVRYGKAVDGEAKRIREAIEPIEEHLKTQCDIVRLEEARMKVATENARRDEVNGWIEQLKELDVWADLQALQRMTAEEFGFTLLSAKRAYSEREAERVELAALRAEKAKREAVGHLLTTADESSPERAKRPPNDEVKNGLNYVARFVRVVVIPKACHEYVEQVQAILDRAAEEIRGLA
tara:strand:+ start:124 stop:876 length:753 start_codon:yes stop_codon:yes gene_type:complete